MRTLVLVVASRAVALVLLALIFTGCVSLTPQQDQRLEEMRGFADRATALYGKPSIRIRIHHTGGVAGRVAARPGAEGAGRQREGGRNPHAGWWAHRGSGRQDRRGCAASIRGVAGAQ